MTTLQLHGYHDIQLIGEGGLGRVYRAVRTSTGGPVAIKELRDIAAASPAWHRARRELDAMLRLKGHPYVVSVEEIVDGPSGPCLVMEYAPGGSLADRIARSPLSTAELILVGQQVSQALAAAHGVGLVHRDVKPHNLLVGQFGQVKVCDFGIAALVSDGGLRTQTQALTLGYASPEALDGDQPVGPAADVYSFGATMAHLMTGSRPSMQERMSGIHPDLRTSDSVLAPIVATLHASLQQLPQHRPSMTQIVAVFERAASELGSRRITSLQLPPVAPAAATAIGQAPLHAATASTVVRPAAPPPPVQPAPGAPLAHTVISAAPTTMASAVYHHPSPQQQHLPYDASTAPIARRRRTGTVLWVIATATALAVIVAGVIVAGNSAGSSPSAIADSSLPLATNPTEPDTTVSTAAPAAAPATTVAPAETVPPTVPATVPTTLAPAPAVTLPLVQPGPPGPAVVNRVLASVVRTPSTDACGNPTEYQPSNVADGRLETAWMAPGNGIGAALTFQLAQSSTVTRVGLVPGYDKFDPCTQTDRFYELRRITAVRWTFDDGSIIDQEVVPEPRMQYLDLPRPIVTSSVTMTVLRTLEPGLERLDHTPVSEVQVL